MKQTIYIIDAFTDRQFGGNPAGVVLLKEWIADDLMQKIAMENNHAETAFVVPLQDGEFHIRWFTPTTEVNLCGHATLASAHVMYQYHDYANDQIVFQSKSGKLYVSRENGLYTLNFPVDYFLETEVPDKLITGLGSEPKEVYIGREDYLCIYEDESKIRRIEPDFGVLAKLKSRGVIISSKGYDVDFVCRFFAPGFGINEDPATGSIQTTLMNYWSKKLGKYELTSLQLSQRIGKFTSRIEGDRVYISGGAVTYLVGEIEL